MVGFSHCRGMRAACGDGIYEDDGKGKAEDGR